MFDGGKKVITFFAGCPRLKTTGSVVIASDSGAGAGRPLPGSSRRGAQTAYLPSRPPPWGRERISFREDDEGKVEDDAVDPRGTTAQITD